MKPVLPGEVDEQFQTLYQFNATGADAIHQNFPTGRLTYGTDGYLYGATYYSVFRFNPNAGAAAAEFLTPSSDGISVTVMEGADNRLYVAEYSGAAASTLAGRIFSMNRDGSGVLELHHHSFTAGGNGPYGFLYRDAAGTVYGTTEYSETDPYPGTVFAIFGSDVSNNHTPIDIALSGSSVPENSPVATTVGTLSTTDFDAADTFTYSFVGGAGSTDNASFTLTANVLKTNAVFDFETKSSYSIRVRSTDSTGLFVEKVLIVAVTNLNEAPTDIALSGNTIPENSASSTAIGNFSTTDPDAGDTFTYTLVMGAGSTDNGSFTITGGVLKSNAVFDYETKAAYSIRVRSMDAGGLFFEKALAIAVSNVNEIPTDIALSNATIAEHLPVATTVGNLSTTDPDAGDTFTYTLVAGAGSTDNASFSIVGGVLKSAAIFDAATKSSYSMRVRSTDAGGLFFEKAFAITVTVNNLPPTDIALSVQTIAENQPSPTVVGTFSTTDPDAGDTFTYSLVAGAGSNENSSFSIVGNTLRSAAVFDYETKASFGIRVRTTDAGGLFFEKAFLITVTNVNEAPTDILLSPSVITETLPVGTAIGNLSTADADAGDTFTYTLVAGIGSGANSLVSIVGNSLRSNAVLDYETTTSLAVRVRSTDAAGLFFEKAFTITVINENEPPTDIALSNGAIPEHLPAGTDVGSLVSTDPDVGSTFTYTLVAGAGATDNGAFIIVGNVLKSNAVFDFATKAAYSIRVRSTDQGGLFFEKAFAVTVSASNSAPTNINLSNSSVAEHQPAATVVGTWSSTDPDPADTFTYTLVAGTGSTDNGSFTIVGSALSTNAVFDFPTKASFSIRVRSTDAGGLFFEKAFVISVTNVNEVPTDIALSNNMVPENWAIPAAVGALSTTDPDSGDIFVYTLVAGAGSADNGSFTIAGNVLRTNAVFDFETRVSYAIRIRSTDQGGLFVEKSFAIGVTNVNETPTDIALSNSTVQENLPANAVVGTLSTSDPDAGDTFTHSLVAGAGSTDNASFTIAGNVLSTTATFDFEAKAGYSVRIRSTDAGGLFLEKVFAIGVANVNEAPTDIVLSSNTIAENQPVGSTIGSLSTTDPDAGDTADYTLVAGIGATDNALFANAGNTLRTNAVLDFENSVSYSIRIRSTDSGGLPIEKVFAINATNTNEGPVAIADVVITSKGNSVVIDVLANDTDPDGDALTVISVTKPASGTATIANGMVTYKPKPNFTGADSFSYSVSDGNGLTASANVGVSVIIGNAPHRATRDRAVTTIGVPVVVPVLANDSDPDGDALALISVTQGATGSVTINADGTVTYAPLPGFTGRDAFTYTIDDGHGATAIGSVSVRVRK